MKNCNTTKPEQSTTFDWKAYRRKYPVISHPGFPAGTFPPKPEKPTPPTPLSLIGENITSGICNADVRWTTPYKLAQHARLAGEDCHRKGEIDTSPGGRPLVTLPITQTEPSKTSFELYPRTVKIKKPFTGKQPTPPKHVQADIVGFSKNSRSRLRFTSANSSEILRSQFGLTYHEKWPADGRMLKKHLNAFLTIIRKKIPLLLYLWIAEFQSRGAPHFHIFLNVKPTAENREILATCWARIADPGNDKLYNVHNHPDNFIPWDMGTGSYLCKYLDKDHQKAIPVDFYNFGRFWGNSQKLIPEPDHITSDEINDTFPPINTTTGEEHDQDALKFIIRTVGRYHEKHHRRSWIRNTNRSTSAITGAPIFRQALDYLHRNREINSNPEPF